LSFEPQEEDAAGTEPEQVGRASGLAPEHHHESLVARVVGFIRGSWRELQRVQWPDRRQVMQATGVVLGFVIVAGAFLGLADLVASHIVKLIL
jgi:preprotein translocase SecE subunit